MPTLDVDQLNVSIAVVGCFTFFFGVVSVLLKHRWFVGEALPIVIAGIVLGPAAGRLLDAAQWGPGSLTEEQRSAVTTGVTKVVIAVQILKAGSELPARYACRRWREMALLLLPVMTLSWLASSAAVLATIPRLSGLAALAVGACFTSTDPVLSQAIAKGPFADKYVRRPLRELISAEAAANDGFGYPFLTLAVFLMRHAEVADKVGEGGERPAAAAADEEQGIAEYAHDVARRAAEVAAAEVGRRGGGVAVALRTWVVETWLYVVLMSVPIGAAIGLGGGKLIKHCLRRRWIDDDSYALFPVALALFITGVCGCLGTDEHFACFVAGVALNWDGAYLREADDRQPDGGGGSSSSPVNAMLTLAGFMYVGVAVPWADFHDPDPDPDTGITTGITAGRLLALGALVLTLRRIPAVMACYRAMPSCVADWKEALFMGYFGPIGIGAIFYAEQAKHLLPPPHLASPGEAALLRALTPAVWSLVLLSVLVHGLSIPFLNAAYAWRGVRQVHSDAVQVPRKSAAAPLPANARLIDTGTEEQYFVAYNRFSRPEPNHRRTVLLSPPPPPPPPQGTIAEERDEEQGHALPHIIGGCREDDPRDSWDHPDPVHRAKIRAHMREASLRKLGSAA